MCMAGGYQIVDYVLDMPQIIIYKTFSLTEYPIFEFPLVLRLRGSDPKIICTTSYLAKTTIIHITYAIQVRFLILKYTTLKYW